MGTSFVFLDARQPECRLKECNLGNVVAGAMVFYYANLTANDARWTDASIAIQDIGDITSSIAVRGNILIFVSHQVLYFCIKMVANNVEASDVNHCISYRRRHFFFFLQLPNMSWLCSWFNNWPVNNSHSVSQSVS